jgi:hypothetical protein
MINEHPSMACSPAGHYKPARPISIATYVLCLLCLAPARGDPYECYANDWFEESAGGSPLSDQIRPYYKNATWLDCFRVWINSQTVAGSLTLRVGDLEITDNSNPWEIAIESYQLYKTANGDWWAEEVCVYRNSNSIVLNGVQNSVRKI